MLNRIILMGRLTRDPELRHTQTGTPVASFSLAVDRVDIDVTGTDIPQEAVDEILANAKPCAAQAEAGELTYARLFCDPDQLRTMAENPPEIVVTRDSADVTGVGTYLGKAGVDALVAVGELSHHIYEAARAALVPEVRWSATKEEAKAALAELIRPGATVLVKASRGMAFEELVDYLVSITPEAEA